MSTATALQDLQHAVARDAKVLGERILLDALERRLQHNLPAEAPCELAALAELQEAPSGRAAAGRRARAWTGG